ncbi:MAG: PepSY domain-containing protein [Xenococcaceae cyanobacterium MO_207.B15]|nr:PepSY domain-containing protein [Xenococcaceae cyanobacterium MO_207.B15]MDJ0742966.1 PepSY domain-containing protein [Xenococcaceae cyanobacterium MO_167.B27]
MAINKARLRYLHYILAPIMFLPIFLTAITGSLFQVAVITGKSEDFLWLLELHRGKFGIIDLELIYPLLNAFGVLSIAITGIIMWLQINKKIKNIHK